MSLQATVWAMDGSCVVDPTARLVLVYLADQCDMDGVVRNVGLLYERLGLPKRSVWAALDVLRHANLVVPSVMADGSAAYELPMDAIEAFWKERQ